MSTSSEHSATCVYALAFSFSLHQGDSLEILKGMKENSIDSIVTDPPYGLKFMGKKWDHSVPSVEIFEQCLRVLKPGGHLLAFAGTRTQHRMAVNIEDAGFEIRDMIAWVYGSGFPKSMNVGKAIDKAAGAEREVIGSKLGQPGYTTSKSEESGCYGNGLNNSPEKALITAPATSEAQQWEGWGTALKPALEPITVARKPFKGTVAGNVLEHGTGAINIDGCRVGTAGGGGNGLGSHYNCFGNTKNKVKLSEPKPDQGRWPANLIHDGSDEVTELFPETKSGARKAGSYEVAAGKGRYGEYGVGEMPEVKASQGSAARFFYEAKPDEQGRWPANLIHDGSDEVTNAFPYAKSSGHAQIKENMNHAGVDPNVFGSGLGGPSFRYGDAGGSAARFFYCPKANKKDRGEGNNHPTVKPTNLMAYLVRLVTPPGGVVLDPFMGSGSTGKACKREGFNFIGCDLDPEFVELARKRIEEA